MELLCIVSLNLLSHKNKNIFSQGIQIKCFYLPNNICGMNNKQQVEDMLFGYFYI